MVFYLGSEKCYNSVFVILDCGFFLGYWSYARKRVFLDGGWSFFSLSFLLGFWRVSLFDFFEGLLFKVFWCCEVLYWCDWFRFFIIFWREILMRMFFRWNDYVLLRFILSIFLVLIVTFGLCKLFRRIFYVVCFLFLRCRTFLRVFKLVLEDLIFFF